MLIKVAFLSHLYLYLPYTLFFFTHPVQLQRLYSNGYPAATSHDAIAYLIVRAGAALDVKNKEGTEPLFFPSESFASILQCIVPPSHPLSFSFLTQPSPQHQ